MIPSFWSWAARTAGRLGSRSMRMVTRSPFVLAVGLLLISCADTAEVPEGSREADDAEMNLPELEIVSMYPPPPGLLEEYGISPEEFEADVELRLKETAQEGLVKLREHLSANPPTPATLDGDAIKGYNDLFQEIEAARAESVGPLIWDATNWDDGLREKVQERLTTILQQDIEDMESMVFVNNALFMRPVAQAVKMDQPADLQARYLSHVEQMVTFLGDSDEEHLEAFISLFLRNVVGASLLEPADE